MGLPSCWLLVAISVLVKVPILLAAIVLALATITIAGQFGHVVTSPPSSISHPRADATAPYWYPLKLMPVTTRSRISPNGELSSSWVKVLKKRLDKQTSDGSTSPAPRNIVSLTSLMVASAGTLRCNTSCSTACLIKTGTRVVVLAGTAFKSPPSRENLLRRGLQDGSVTKDGLFFADSICSIAIELMEVSDGDGDKCWGDSDCAETSLKTRAGMSMSTSLASPTSSIIFANAASSFPRVIVLPSRSTE
mmetsp:Transcript_109787/g.199933  ORF Transcript_109787/g.199933 Transcript_109787/m.199933 type:complete len:249 (-) Transcript_109787:2284-3030(-)